MVALTEFSIGTITNEDVHLLSSMDNHSEGTFKDVFGPFKDAHNRNISYIRISITDVLNKNPVVFLSGISTAKDKDSQREDDNPLLSKYEVDQDASAKVEIIDEDLHDKISKQLENVTKIDVSIDIHKNEEGNLRTIFTYSYLELNNDLPRPCISEFSTDYVDPILLKSLSTLRLFSVECEKTTEPGSKTTSKPELRIKQSEYNELFNAYIDICFLIKEMIKIRDDSEDVANFDRENPEDSPIFHWGSIFYDFTRLLRLEKDAIELQTGTLPFEPSKTATNRRGIYHFMCDAVDQGLFITILEEESLTDDEEADVQQSDEEILSKRRGSTWHF